MKSLQKRGFFFRSTEGIGMATPLLLSEGRGHPLFKIVLNGDQSFIENERLNVLCRFLRICGCRPCAESSPVDTRTECQRRMSRLALPRGVRAAACALPCAQRSGAISPQAATRCSLLAAFAAPAIRSLVTLKNRTGSGKSLTNVASFSPRRSVKEDKGYGVFTGAQESS